MKTYELLTEKQREYRRLAPQIDAPSVETRQSIRKEMRKNANRARSIKQLRTRQRKEMDLNQRPRRELARWAIPLLTAPYNKRSRKSKLRMALS